MDDNKQEAYKELARRELARRESQQKSWLQRAGEDVDYHINKPIEALGRGARDIAGGFAQGTANIAPGVANLGISGINALGGNVPKIPMIDVVPHGTGETVGNIASFFGGPGILKAPFAAANGLNALGHIGQIPEVANAIKKAASILGEHPRATKSAGSAILGGAYAPENPLAGMGLGVLGGLAGEGASKIFDYIKSSPDIAQGIKSVPSKAWGDIKNSLENNKFLQDMYAKINPAQHQKEVEHLLSGGTNNVEQTGKQLATDIRNAYNMRNEQSGAFFNHVMNQVGHEPIYENENIWLGKRPESENTINQLRNLKIGDAFDIFKNEPTLNNAHTLKTQIGHMIGELKGTFPRPPNYMIKLGRLNNAYQTINNDILKYLEKRDSLGSQALAPLYQRGVDLYREHVAPFLNDNKIINVTRHRNTNEKNLHQAFEYPTDKISPEGKESIGNINKIMQDLPPESRNRILFGAVGGNKQSPEQLLQSLFDVKSKGYSSYFTPELEEHMSLIGSKIKNRNRLRRAGKTAGAGVGIEAAHRGVNHLL